MINDAFSVGRAFGEPIERDGCTVVPVAWVAGGGGRGTGPREEGGEGAGSGGVSWPLGVYEIRDGHVRWVPVINVTRMVVAGLALARAIVRRSSRR